MARGRRASPLARLPTPWRLSLFRRGAGGLFKNRGGETAEKQSQKRSNGERAFGPQPAHPSRKNRELGDPWSIFSSISSILSHWDRPKQSRGLVKNPRPPARNPYGPITELCCAPTFLMRRLNFKGQPPEHHSRPDDTNEGSRPSARMEPQAGGALQQGASGTDLAQTGALRRSLGFI